MAILAAALVVVASPAPHGQAIGGNGPPLSADSATRAAQLRARAAAVQAESAQAKAERDVVQAEAAEESTAAAIARGEVPARTRREKLVDAANVAIDLAALALLAALWFALGRPRVQRWLAERHGAQVLLLWGAAILFTLASCASSLLSIFSRPEEPTPEAPVLAIVWVGLVIVTWRWASARGVATRAR